MRMRKLLLVALIALAGCRGAEPARDAVPGRHGAEGLDTRALEARERSGRTRRRAEEYRKAGVPVIVLWKSPMREDDREQQVEVVEGFISQGVNGLVLAPLDSNALLRPVEEAEARRYSHRDFRLGARQSIAGWVSYVSTDNGKGGRLAAKRMGDVLKGSRDRADAALSGRLGRHRRTREGISRRTESQLPRRSP